MLTVAEKLQEKTTTPGHIMSSRGGVVVDVNYVSQEENIEETPQTERITEIEGKCGTITVLKSSRPMKETHQDIHSLISKVLLMKEKRLQATD